MGELARASSTTTTTTSSGAGSPQSMDEFYRQQRMARSDSVDSVDSMTSGDESSGPSRRSRRMTLRNNGAAFLGSISQRFHKKDPTREQLQQQSAYHQHQQRLSHHRRKPVVLLYDRVQTKSQSGSNQLVSDDELEDEQDDSAAEPFDVLIAMADRTSTASTASSASTPAMPTAPAHPARHPLSSSYSATGSRIPRPPRSSHGQTKYDVEWRRDQDYSACHICAVPFTKLSRRRHHCRLCGEIICGACSPDQVQVIGLFPAPKRSCVACFTLLHLLMHEGDPRARWLDAAAAAQVFPPPTTRAVAHSSSTPVAAQTPRYHDRKVEMRRVAAAGTKSKRRGSTQVDLVVISSKWLRQWLAFTLTEGHGGVNADDGDLRNTYYVRRRIESADSSHNNNTFEDEDAPPPGPIMNLHLLEMRRGQLMQRPGLVRGKQTPGQPQDDAASDYQLISSDVWDVLQRLYCGGPRIRVHANREGSQRLEWVVDVEPMLTNASGPLSIPAIVQTSLLHRHYRALAPVPSSAPSPSNEFSSSNHLFRRSSAARISGASAASAASPVNTRQSQSWRQQPPRSAPHYQQQYHEQPMDLRELDTSAASSNQHQEQEEVEKAASSAASAFAVAMKQARLDAQKALDERSSRVYA